MNASELTFGIKDVVAIIIGVIGIAGFLYALRRASDSAKDSASSLKSELDQFKKDVDEKFLHAKNAKKANIQMVMEALDKTKEEVEKKEAQLYTRMEEIRKDQKDGQEKLWVKLDSVEKMQHSMSTALAELTGFLKASKKNTDHE